MIDYGEYRAKERVTASSSWHGSSRHIIYSLMGKKRMTIMLLQKDPDKETRLQNVPYERHSLRSMAQKPNETVIIIILYCSTIYMYYSFTNKSKNVRFY